MSLPAGANVPVGPDTPPERQPPVDDPREEAFIGRLIERLATMGVFNQAGGPSTANGFPPQQQQQQAAEQRDDATLSAEGDHWSADDWTQSWWYGGWNGRWKPSDREERPFLSHVDFPKFDGKKESYPNYQYAVLNLKSQCAPKDYKYLAPRLIANFTGSMQDDARAMELLGNDFLVDNGVELLLDFLKKRLHITELNLETEAFEKYFNHLARKKEKL